MPRLRKVFPHRSVIFVTISVEQGLALPANPLMNAVLWGILGRAQYLHPVKICHFVIEATHAHFMLVVENPDDVKDFIERFKTESAHAVNRMLGRKKRTVWCKGYDSPVVLTKNRAMHYIKYIYNNPSKDGLENIDKYPGLTSWHMYKNGTKKRRCKWIRRMAISKVIPGKFSYKSLAHNLLNKSKEEHVFSIDPDAWMESFEIESRDHKDINKDLRLEVIKQEEYYAGIREKEGKDLLGAAKLKVADIDMNYWSKDRSGRRTLCVSEDISLRKKFIKSIKLLIEKGKEVYERWKLGDFSVPYPEGLYPPPMPKLVEPLDLYALM